MEDVKNIISMSGLHANTYSPPKWLTQDFLQAALREGCRRGSLNVRTCSFTPATNVGDNYLSQMFRASARVTNRKGSQDMSVVIKSMPTGEAAEKFMSEGNFFEKETLMLSETLPQLQEVLNEIGGQRLFAHLYFKNEGPETSLVMEDLCESGFQNVNRLDMLDMDHSVLVMEYLAIFHAASLRAIENHPEIKISYKDTFWQRDNYTRVFQYFDHEMENLSMCLKAWNFPNDMIEKIENFHKNGLEKVFRCTDVDDTELNVLNHADPWTCNFMFKFENNLPVDMRFVDFQLCCFNSPAFDILYFLFTSPQNDVRVSRFDELLEKYYAKLKSTCEKLKYNLDISFEGIRKLVYNRLAFGFFIGFVIFPFTLTESSDATDLNEYLQKAKDNRGLMLSRNIKYKQAVESFLPFLDQYGVFD